MRLSARSTIRSWLVCLVFLLVVAIPATAMAGTVSGTVTDAQTGEPIANAWIDAYLLPDYYESQYTETDFDGSYFLGLTEGWWEVRVGAPGYDSAWVEVDGDAINVSDFALEPAVAGVSGTVVDADSGELLSGGMLLSYYDEIDMSWYEIDWAECANGEYTFYGLYEGTEYAVTSDIWGYENQMAESFVYDGTLVTRDFSLTAMTIAGIGGSVTDADTGEPIWGEVYLEWYDTAINDWVHLDTAYAEPGDYLFPFPEVGDTYRLWTSFGGYENQQSEPFVYDGDPLTFDFQLVPGVAGVSGTITDAESGDSLAGNVYLHQWDTVAEEWYIVDSSWVDDGYYQFFGLQNGEFYAVGTDMYAYENQVSDQFWFDDTPQTIDFQLMAATPAVVGSVTGLDSEETLWGGVIVEHQDEEGAWSTVDTVWCDEMGYAVYGLTPSTGAYRLTTDIHGWIDESSEPFYYDGTPLEPIDFVLEQAPVEVTGAITDADSGEPIEGEVALFIYDEVDDYWYDWDWAWSSGSYEFRDLTSGSTYLVQTAYEDYYDQSSEPFVADGSLRELDFALEMAPIGVSGTVTDADSGEPLYADLYIEYYDEVDESWYETGYAWTEDAGYYDFRGLTMDVLYRVTTQVNDYINQSEEFTYAGEPLTIDFQLTIAPVGVQGTVTDIDTGEPLSGADVYLQKYDDEWEEWYEVGYGWSEDGDYVLRGLEEGVEYRVVATAHGYEEEASEPFVFDGTVQTLDFALTAKPSSITGSVTDATTDEPVQYGWVDVQQWDEYDNDWYTIEWAEIVDGQYTIRGLEAGEYRIWASGWGYYDFTSEPFTYSGGVLEMSFQLDPMPLGVGGTITDAVTGEPIGAGITIEYYDEGLGEWIGDGGYYEGEYAFFELEVGGEYRLSAESEGYIGQTAEPFVYDGDPVIIDFALAPEDSSVVVEPIAGTSRYGTAIAASEQAFPEGANCVVIATGSNWPDALGGASLAAAKGGPILLTQQNVLPAEVLAEIRRLDATEAIVLGGKVAVSDAVVTALKNELGVSNVIRIGGQGRFETAELIAEKTVEVLGEEYDGTCFIATGGNFPDALGASPLAAAKGWPLLLSGPAGLSTSTLDTIDTIGVDKALILGGKTVVPDVVFAQLAGRSPQRLAGTSRYDTAKVVAEYGVANAGLGWDKVALATGGNFPDALAGGVLQGLDGSVMLLTPSGTLADAPKAALMANKDDITTVRFLGGNTAITPAVRAAVAALFE